MNRLENFVEQVSSWAGVSLHPDGFEGREFEDVLFGVACCRQFRSRNRRLRILHGGVQ